MLACFIATAVKTSNLTREQPPLNSISPHQGLNICWTAGHTDLAPSGDVAALPHSQMTPPYWCSTTGHRQYWRTSHRRQVIPRHEDFRKSGGVGPRTQHGVGRGQWSATRLGYFTRGAGEKRTPDSSVVHQIAMAAVATQQPFFIT
jgi:hypothetical protein